MRQSTMRVKLRLFGQLREVAGVADRWHELSVGGSVADLLVAVRREMSLPEGLLNASALAVNLDYAQPDRILSDGDEVAILPPVSGGVA